MPIELIAGAVSEGVKATAVATKVVTNEIGKTGGKLLEGGLEISNGCGEHLMPKLNDILNTSPEQLDNRINELRPLLQNQIEQATTTEPLSEEDKVLLKEKNDWSDEITENIKSKEEAAIYEEAELHEETINEKECLVRDDIDWSQKDEMGRTNQERCEQGLSPINKEGKTIELHHIGQKADSPLAELTQEEHRGKGNDGILHDKNKVSEIDREKFNDERAEHWRARAEQGTERKQ